MNRNDIFSTDGWIPVNKKLAHTVGLEAAAIYGELNRKEKWFYENGKLYEGGWFFVTHDDLEASTAIKRRGQDRGINKLIEAGLLERQVSGMPARRFFRLNDLQFEQGRTNQSDQTVQTGLHEPDKQDCSKRTRNNNKSNNNNLNNNKNNNQSITEPDIEALDVPIQIQQPLIKNRQRLIDDQIHLGDIETAFKAYSERVNKQEFSMILNNILETMKEPIRNITGIIRTSIENHIQGMQAPEKEADDQPGEVLPDWFYEQKQAEQAKREAAAAKENQKTEAEKEAEREETRRMLESYLKEK